jgi:hypothetical protein
MKPNPLNLITRGLLGINKAISLITKGFLDELEKIAILRGLRKIRGYAFDLHYNVIGKKAFSKAFIYNIIGTKLFELVRQFALKAKKSIKSVFASLIQAKVQTPFALKTSINGQIGRKINSSLNISGIKATKHFVELEMAGVSQTFFSQENYVKASKSFLTLYTSMIQGIKKTNKIQDINIKGKRDITNILVALDLIN